MSCIAPAQPAQSRIQDVYACRMFPARTAIAAPQQTNTLLESQAWHAHLRNAMTASCTTCHVYNQIRATSMAETLCIHVTGRLQPALHTKMDKHMGLQTGNSGVLVAACGGPA